MNNQEMNILDIIFLWSLMQNMSEPGNTVLCKNQGEIVEKLKIIIEQNNKILEILERK